MAWATATPESDDGWATCCVIAGGATDGVGVTACNVNRMNVVPEPAPALRKTGVYPITGPYRANCVCSGALYTTTPSGALVPAWTLNTGTATSRAGTPPASISRPSIPGGHWVRSAGLAAIVALDSRHAAVAATCRASRTDARLPVTCGRALCSHALVAGWVVAP